MWPVHHRSRRNRGKVKWLGLSGATDQVRFSPYRRTPLRGSSRMSSVCLVFLSNHVNHLLFVRCVVLKYYMYPLTTPNKYFRIRLCDSYVISNEICFCLFLTWNCNSILVFSVLKNTKTIFDFGNLIILNLNFNVVNFNVVVFVLLQC